MNYMLMAYTLMASMLIITLAPVCYTVGVFRAKRRKYLLPADLYWFGVGFLCDAFGTFLMNRMSASGERALAPWASNLMLFSGTAALLLMALHIGLALRALKKEERRKSFHKLSFVIWLFWLFSYFLDPLVVIAFLTL